MGALIITHDEHGNSQVLEPDREFALVLGDRTILADTRTDLIEALNPGYADLLAGPNGQREAAWSRYTFLLGAADALASTVLAAMVNAGDVEITALSEDELNFIIPPDRIQARPFIGNWTSRVPLVALRSDYAPFTDVPEPTGNVKFLDPSNETTFIDSLVEAGIAHFMVNESAQVAA
ncbi:hypothetical protein GCG21_13675 [Pseudactinotalea sp. HY160]|uniref:hypothetical protein n=1 Tax=Pseudactinotalea sp. HY160 TaxID=2654490 RepID=UPI00128BDB3F|nr:hypothetical protein [Pseudactinotalea sp. HY160]MPV51036.1 hypothetical protein [Pseudactinotalea sp. HY160]